MQVNQLEQKLQSLQKEAERKTKLLHLKQNQLADLRQEVTVRLKRCRLDFGALNRESVGSFRCLRRTWVSVSEYVVSTTVGIPTRHH
jgi:hypothetical protein